MRNFCPSIYSPLGYDRIAVAGLPAKLTAIQLYRYLFDFQILKKYNGLMTLQDELKKWRGGRNDKTAASDLGIPLPSYRKYLNGDRVPNKLAIAELRRRMNGK